MLFQLFKRNPEKEIEKMEESIREIFDKIKKENEEDIYKIDCMLKDKSHRWGKRPPKYRMVGVNYEENMQRMAAELSMETKYMRLKEKFKHEPQVRLKLAKDWRDYVRQLGEIRHAGRMLEADAFYDSNEIIETYKKIGIITNEIEKRFDKLLKN